MKDSKAEIEKVGCQNEGAIKNANTKTPGDGGPEQATKQVAPRGARGRQSAKENGANIIANN